MLNSHSQKRRHNGEIGEAPMDTFYQCLQTYNIPKNRLIKTRPLFSEGEARALSLRNTAVNRYSVWLPALCR